jgi:hypothetical protein
MNSALKSDDVFMTLDMLMQKVESVSLRHIWTMYDRSHRTRNNSANQEEHASLRLSLQSSLTDYAVDLIVEQYDVDTKVDREGQLKDGKCVINCSALGKAVEINPSTAACSCPMRTQVGLPCRHQIWYLKRFHKFDEAAIANFCINKADDRWKHSQVNTMIKGHTQQLTHSDSGNIDHHLLREGEDVTEFTPDYTLISARLHIKDHHRQIELACRNSTIANQILKATEEHTERMLRLAEQLADITLTEQSGHSTSTSDSVTAPSDITSHLSSNQHELVTESQLSDADFDHNAIKTITGQSHDGRSRKKMRTM